MYNQLICDRAKYWLVLLTLPAGKLRTMLHATLHVPSLCNAKQQCAIPSMEQAT